MIPKIGSRYIIEIEDIYKPYTIQDMEPQTQYKIKGVNSLLLTEEEISRLTPIETYNSSLLEAILKNLI